MYKRFLACPLLTILASWGAPGCDAPPERLATEETVKALDRADQASAPPLYQVLYDSAFLPEVQYAEQRTRILIWLRWVGLEEHQLRELAGLHGRARTLRERVEHTQAEIIRAYEPDLVPAYNAIWDALRRGAPLDDPALAAAAEPVLSARKHKAREDELLAVRLQSVRALLDEEQEFLRQLTPRQEILFADLLFVLRRDLDPSANPGDFRALVGTLFSAGEPTLLLRGDFDPDRKPLNLGGLWTEQAEQDLTAPVLHEARRELLLYLLLQEPALPEAIDAAIAALGQPPQEAPPDGAATTPSRP